MQLKFFRRHPTSAEVSSLFLFFSNEDLIKRFGGADKIKPYKACVKQCRDLFDAIDWHLLSKDKIKEVLNEFGANKYCVFAYYTTKYKKLLIDLLIFWEYIYAVIGENNVKSIEIDDIDFSGERLSAGFFQ